MSEELFIARDRYDLASRLMQDVGRLGLVMTMGALHEGHLDLVREARATCDVVLVSIFVNPLQFADVGDFQDYPRDLEADCAKLENLGVDIVFAPSVDTMYPHGEPLVRLDVGTIGKDYEGKVLPGYFEGVTQVVCKMINMVQPDVAFFGQKDAQQLAVIRQLVRDLDMPIEIKAVPTRRDADGIALANHNENLSEEQREQAQGISKALFAGQREAAASGSANRVKKAADEELSKCPGLVVEYVDLVDPMTFQPLDKIEGIATGCLILGASIGRNRLIDNQLVVVNRP